MKPMSPTEDIRAARHALAAKFDNDLDRIVADLRRQQQESGGQYLRLPKRAPSADPMTNKAMQRSGNKRVENG